MKILEVLTDDYIDGYMQAIKDCEWLVKSYKENLPKIHASTEGHFNNLLLIFEQL